MQSSLKLSIVTLIENRELGEFRASSNNGVIHTSIAYVVQFGCLRVLLASLVTATAGNMME